MHGCGPLQLLTCMSCVLCVDCEQVGWGTGSLAYHADSGKKLSGVGSLGTVEQAFGSAWRAGDVVGCGLNFEKKQVCGAVWVSLFRSLSVLHMYPL